MLASSRWMVPLVPTSFSLVNVNIDKTSLSKCQEFLILTMILPDSGLSSHEISNSLRLLMTRFRKLMLIPPLPSLPLYLSPPPLLLLLPSSCLRLSPGHHLSGPAAVELYTLLCSLFSLWFILTSYIPPPPELKPTLSSRAGTFNQFSTRILLNDSAWVIN